MIINDHFYFNVDIDLEDNNNKKIFFKSWKWIKWK